MKISLLGRSRKRSEKLRTKTYDDLPSAIERIVEWHLAIDLLHGLNVDFDRIKWMAGER